MGITEANSLKMEIPNTKVLLHRRKEKITEHLPHASHCAKYWRYYNKIHCGLCHSEIYFLEGRQKKNMQTDKQHHGNNKKVFYAVRNRQHFVGTFRLSPVRE